MQSTKFESLQVINATGQRSREKEIVLSAIRTHGALTSRALSIITKRERSSICRAVFDLLHDSPPLIRVCFTAPCPITRKRVKWYAIRKPRKETNLPDLGNISETKLIQPELFQ
jgi:hypothetical protein